MAKKKVTVEAADKAASSIRDELSSIIAKNLDKTFKDADQVVWFLDEPEDAPTTVTDWISTGSTVLDLAISNRPHGGYPVGRIVELTGLEGAGKSLLAAHALAETQRRGGVAVFIDTESAVSSEFFEAIGVNLKNMMYIPAETVEFAFESVESIINSVRSSDTKDRLVTIVVDSLAGASTKVEMDANYDKDGWATAKAIILSKAMRKITNLIAKEKILLIFTNQLRQKLNAMAFADPWTTSGGKAVAFHSSVRIRLSAAGKIKDTDKEVVGIDLQAKVIKNRVGPPYRTSEFKMFFDSGIDNYSGWLDALEAKKLISKSGQNYSFDIMDEATGESLREVNFKKKDFPQLESVDKEAFDYLYKKLCDSNIMKYRKAGEIREDVEVVPGGLEE